MAKKQKKRVYLVYSACEDQQQTFVDAVVARNEEDAKKKVQKLRGEYAFTDYAGTLGEHLEYTQSLAMKTIREVASDWRHLCKCAN